MSPLVHSVVCGVDEGAGVARGVCLDTGATRCVATFSGIAVTKEE
jgi:hypothetical protein